MVSQAEAPARKGYPYAVTLDGLTYVFETEEEERAFIHEYEEAHREERQARWAEAMKRLDALDERIKRRTGGKGIPVEELDRAWREAKEH